MLKLPQSKVIFRYIAYLFVAIIGFYILLKKNNFANNNRIYKIGCKIVDQNAKIIKNFSGPYCLFRDNGEVLASNPNSEMKYFSQHGNLIWTDKNPSHHKLVLSRNQNNFMAITSEINAIDNYKIRSDVFSVRDFNNNILKSWSTFKNLNELKSLNLHYFRTCKKTCFGKISWLSLSCDGEITHANSFQEISEFEEVPGSPIWKRGNYLVYLFGQISTALLLDADMKKILWHFDFRAINRLYLHDLQLIPGGKLLVFFNKNFSSNIIENYSSVEILDIFDMKTVWKYTRRNTKDIFYSEQRGGVQLLQNGNILYTESEDILEAREIDREGKEVFKLVSPFKEKDGKSMLAQEIKMIEAAAFLKNNKM